MTVKTGADWVHDSELSVGDTLVAVIDSIHFIVKEHEEFRVVKNQLNDYCIVTHDGILRLSHFDTTRFKKKETNTMVEKVGCDWANSKTLKAGDRLLCVHSTNSYTVCKGVVYTVTFDPASTVPMIITPVQKVCLSCYTSTKFRLVEQVNWELPLFVEKFSNPPVTKVGTTKDGFVVIENSDGCLYKANATTGVLTLDHDLVVTNRVEPWRQAYNQYTCDWNHKSEETLFREIFELGRTWKQN